MMLSQSLKRGVTRNSQALNPDFDDSYSIPDSQNISFSVGPSS